MTDVFISYKKEDVARVEPIARALAQAGYEVWWDHHIPPGRSYRDVIGNALQTAKCVVVVWSKLSVAGQWVLDEADAGKSRNVLLPLMIDEVEIPYGFRQIEAGRLIGWAGDTSDHEWRNALNAVAHFVGRAPGGPPKPFATPKAAPRATVASSIDDAPQKKGGGGGLVIGLVLVALLAGGGWYAYQSGMIGGPKTLETAETTDPDAALPPPPATTPEIETHEGDMNAPAPLPEAPATTGLKRVAFESGGAIVREASGTWIEENDKTGALDGARWREESRDADTITLRDDGRQAGMRIELSENAIYLYFPDWGKWQKQWVIGEKSYE
jgi:hypothetical protein